MAIRLKNGAIYLHIPKTGGNWITAILKEMDLIESRIAHKHADVSHFYFPSNLNYKEYLKFHIDRLRHQTSKKKPYMFCFVRNPLAWYESWYKYMEQPSRQWIHWGDEKDINKWHPIAMLNGLGGGCDFDQFVQNVNKKRPGFVTEMFAGFTKPQIDFIGKQENLEDDFIRLLNDMNVKFDEGFIREYGKVGVSAKPKKKVVWPHQLKVETALYEYAGLVRYGYQSTLDELGIGLTEVLSKEQNKTAAD